VKVPAANLLRARRVLDEHYPILELDEHALEQLNVLEQIVVRIGRVAVLVVVAVDEQANKGLLA